MSVGGSKGGRALSRKSLISGNSKTLFLSSPPWHDCEAYFEVSS